MNIKDFYLFDNIADVQVQSKCASDGNFLMSDSDKQYLY